MKEKQLIILCAFLVAILSAAVLFRIHTLENQFRLDALRMKEQTSNYDQEFITMVNRLETELAERASFPYLGGKDPMTGKVRFVVAEAKPKTNGKAKSVKSAKPEPVAVVETKSTAPVDSVVSKPVPPPKDPVRLTAIIYDDFKKAFTAIMMVGERSYSVEVGDKIHGRITTQISANSVILEDSQKRYNYDISGNISNRVK